MPLHGPNHHDVYKLHQEITQVVNQRLLVTTFAITVFGAIVAWSFPQTDPGKNTVQPFLASTALNLILGALLWLHHKLIFWLRTLTAYLEETGESRWEKDWTEFRKNSDTNEKFKYEGYTEPQMRIFKLLGRLGTFFPWVFSLLYSPAANYSLWGVISLAGRISLRGCLSALWALVSLAGRISLRGYLSALLSVVTGILYMRLWSKFNARTDFKAYEKRIEECWAELNQSNPTAPGPEAGSS